MGTFKGFSQVELRKPTRSTFDLSHENRLSTRIGKLTPIFITETIPNDTFRASSEVLVKLAPMIFSIFHRLNLYVHFFFVPNRLLWEDWETFITGGRLGEAVTTAPVPPHTYINALLAVGGNYLEVGSLSDYLGVPPISDADAALWVDRKLDLMPHAAMYRIWYDYYRDRNYVGDDELLPLASGLNGGPLNDTLFATRYRCWQHDYFTSALPFTQRGAEVLMPLQGSGTVTYLSTSSVFKFDGTNITGDAKANAGQFLVDPGSGSQNARVENIDEVNIINSDVSINDLRRAIALQTWMERNALAGSRYNESIMAHFARKTSDSRLQRAEYLGGGKAVIEISEINTTAFSTSEGGTVVPPGFSTGRGSTYSNTNNFTYNCEEHGFIIGVLSAMPTSAYMQGLPRMFQNRNTFLDYPWPSFAHLGEQEVFNAEIYSDPASVPVDRTTMPIFGYQSRYSDWKFINSQSHGDFRTSLINWHLTRDFANQPVLGSQFVTFEDGLQDRIFSVSGVDTMWMYIYNKCTVKRSLPYFGTPSTITR